jgi:hypothetical protein
VSAWGGGGGHKKEFYKVTGKRFRSSGNLSCLSFGNILSRDSCLSDSSSSSITFSAMRMLVRHDWLPPRRRHQPASEGEKREKTIIGNCRRRCQFGFAARSENHWTVLTHSLDPPALSLSLSQRASWESSNHYWTLGEEEEGIRWAATWAAGRVASLAAAGKWKVEARHPFSTFGWDRAFGRQSLYKRLSTSN